MSAWNSSLLLMLSSSERIGLADHGAGSKYVFSSLSFESYNSSPDDGADKVELGIDGETGVFYTTVSTEYIVIR
ncbi:hypothetical protein EV424DRAFT_1385180 [Suillus variegatus]|nr:hypothetical protein EV424DRAFT_1385180 [Suillus variegatus]